ncbi:MAG: response regulator [Bacillota bacterium]|nr:response regulator [Bacillota bacterium]
MIGKKVLIVDDQAGIRALLREVFSVFGFEVIEAQNGYEGLERLERRPDIILLDMKMPGLSGIETLRQLRIKNATVPVILVTAYQELEMVNEAERLGVTARLIKPFDLDELQCIVRRVTETPELQVAGA